MKLYHEEISGSAKDLNEVPIIFLHGLFLCGKWWKYVAPDISMRTQRKAYIPDARNHGKSPWVDEMNIEALCNDLLEFMEDHNIKKAVLIGSSVGGRTALYFALKFPHKVDALVVEDMTPRNVVTANKNLVQMCFKAMEELLDQNPPEMDLDEAKQVMLEAFLMFVCPKYADKEKVQKYLTLDMIPIIKKGNRFVKDCNTAALHSFLNSNALVQDLPDSDLVYDGPALFLYGSKPFFNLGKDPSIKKLFPRALVKKIEGASHCIHIDSPEIYAQTVSDFILHKDLPGSKF